jgi:hypothetical protein
VKPNKCSQERRNFPTSGRISSMYNFYHKNGSYVNCGSSAEAPSPVHSTPPDSSVLCTFPLLQATGADLLILYPGSLWYLPFLPSSQKTFQRVNPRKSLWSIRPDQHCLLRPFLTLEIPSLRKTHAGALNYAFAVCWLPMEGATGSDTNSRYSGTYFSGQIQKTSGQH